MDAKTRQLMKTKQGKVETGSGIPGGSDGYEGQVLVRDTKDGPMLFAKLKGRWIESPLAGYSKDNIPRIWSTNVILPASAGGSIAILPRYIPLDNILNISLVIQKVSSGATEFYQSIPENSGALTGFGVRLTLITKDRSLNIAVLAALYRGLNAKLTVFYK